MDDLVSILKLLRTRFVCSAKLSQWEWGRGRKGPRLRGRSLDPAGDQLHQALLDLSPLIGR